MIQVQLLPLAPSRRPTLIFLQPSPAAPRLSFSKILWVLLLGSHGSTSKALSQFLNWL